MKVNGTVFPLGKSLSLYAFLEKQKFNAAKVAVELNGKIVPKAAYADIMLKDEDVLEIVRFVGGG